MWNFANGSGGRSTEPLPVNLTPDPDLKYTIDVVLPRLGRSIEILHVNEDGSKKSIGRYRFEGQRFVKE